ncbi:hypothetical protein J4416_01930 [Candidatus Pacearchaeota archaeon]|nr:hypothetical protein [Candidatus Pacearchaeota archaeon]
MKRIYLSFAFLVCLIGFASAQVVSSDNGFSGSRTGTASFVNYGSSFNSYYGGQASTYWPVLSNREFCTANQDIVIQVSPVGCQPAVVRSDLLAEQNVPVFCQLDLLQVNPTIDIKQIRNIRFNGKYPEYVAGVGFHPANAALRTTNSLLGTPLQSNIGYVVVVLKRNPDEKTLPKFFNFTLSASIDYYSENSLGIGTTELIIRDTNNDEWSVAKNKQSLFGGKMSVRVRDTENNNSIKLELYSGDIKHSELTLQKNSPQPNSVYLPGSYCQTSLQFNYDNFNPPSSIARIQVDDDILDVYVGSRFLNGKCLVRKVENDNVDVSCGSETFKLSSSYNVLNVEEEIYKINANFSVDKNKTYTISKVIRNESGVFYEITVESKAEQISIMLTRPVSLPELVDKEYERNYGKYISDALNQYSEIVNNYGNERKNDLGLSYGEVALTNAIELAVKYDKRNTAVDLIDQYLNLYPQGSNEDKFMSYLNGFYSRDNSFSSQNVETDDGFHLIRLIDVSGVSKKSSAKISWRSTSEEIIQGMTKDFTVGKISLIKVIDSNSVEIKTTCTSTGNNDNSKVYGGIVRLNDRPVTACGEIITLSGVDFQNYIKLRISPVTKSGSVSNFTVGVGIEKRAIELTPSRAKKQIENLNKTIKTWTSISNKLGETVTGLKAACFATAGVLTVKNFFTGLDGEALARRGVMSGPGGWTDECQKRVNNKEYSSLTACYNANSEQIAKGVEASKKAIKATNELTKKIEDGAKYPNREGIFAGENFNDTQAKKELIDEIISECRTQTLGVKNEDKPLSSLFPSGYNVDSYTYSQLRDIYFNCQVIKQKGSSIGDAQATAELDNIGALINERLRYEKDSADVKSSAAGTGLGGIQVPTYGGKDAIVGNYFGGKLEPLDFGLRSDYVGKPAQIVYYDSTPYLAVLRSEGNTLVVDKMFELTKEGDNYVVPAKFNEASGVKNKFSKFETRDAKSYNNQFGPGEATVKYFETEPYKGLPAIVPFDLNRGFYAATTQSLPLFGGTKSYESSGAPSSFFVCNVMKDRRVGFYAPNYGDDECVQFNIYTGQSFSSFPGLSESDTKKLVSDAIRALEDAARQYGKGKTVKIGGNTLNVGQAASLVPGSQCQDFMSPTDCKILFNVCDPVICPTSRCNFGGEYYVSDVIQSGIVGSALLCLPNYQDGIVLPVCLTGIKAGIDGYLSVLKSHQQCLQEAIDTGKYVGICDQVSSVYMCEFFWRQAAPLAKIVIPKIVEHVYTGGQGNVRGGGEYMTVQSSWQNAEDSASYFTQNYAKNSFDAFKIRNIEEAGTEICRAFISAKGPKAFETLIEPDSPSQFHAWYSAIDFTDATIPATSQYKVFYHIFAGNDRGVSFSVYLKDPPASSQYATNPVVVVANGFVTRGQYATESKDFTAPKGYQQLCVRINDKEECGFKQVSSSFAVNYVSDSIVSDELARTDITTEAECVSGSVSPLALLNPNLQSAGEEALNPAIYNRGIVRVCATSNPGSATTPNRFVEVGYCGTGRLKCWLDKDSLNKAITEINVGLKNKTLSEIEQIQKQTLNANANPSDPASLNIEIDGLRSQVDKADGGSIGGIVFRLKDLFDKAFFDKDKAEILLLRAKAFENVFVKSVSSEAVKSSGAPAPGSSTPATTPSGASEKRILSFYNGYNDKKPSYLFLSGQPTSIYLLGSKVYSDKINILIGSVNENGKIAFITAGKDIVDTTFGEGSYDFFNGRGIWIENINGSCDLDILESCTGSVKNVAIPSGNGVRLSLDSKNYLTLDDMRVTPEIYLDGIFLKRPVTFWPDSELGAFPEDRVLWLIEDEKSYLESALGKGSFEFLNRGGFTQNDLRSGIILNLGAT